MMDFLARSQPVDFQHIVLGNGLPAKGNELVQGGLGIPHSAVGQSRDRLEGGVFDLDLFARCDKAQLTTNLFFADGSEFESLTPAHNGRQNFFGLGSGENEFHM